MANKQSQTRSATIKVGLLAVVSLALLVFVLVWIRGRGLNPGVPHDVLFKDVDGMREGAPVQMMGIRIGFVDTINPEKVNEKYFVRVAFNVNHPDVTVPVGSTISVEQSGIIGEKFLEVSPPKLQSVVMTTFKAPGEQVASGIPVKFAYENSIMTVGAVEHVEQTVDENLTRHKLYYRITRPGALMPKAPVYELKMEDSGQYYLLVLPEEPVLSRAPDKELLFTVQEPVRMKEFLEIQLESAAALKLTNEKIAQLLSDENIANLSGTVKNTEVLTARATAVLENANELLKVADKDMEELVHSSEHLAKNLISVSDNLNLVIGDPALQADVRSTIASIEDSAKALSGVMNDPALRETIALAKDTTHDASELVEVLTKTAKDKELQARLDNSLLLLNESLDKLSTVLGSVEAVTDDDDDTIKGILTDSQEATANLKTFSAKLNKRFLLFRLMF